jgi:hypothetical protein
LFSNETGIGLDELSQLENKMSIDHAIALIWAGMKDGARVEKIDFKMTLDDVADLLDDDPTVINQCVAFFVESFVKPSVDGKK